MSDALHRLRAVAWPVVLIWAYVDVPAPCKGEYDTPLGVDGERLDKFYEQGKRAYGRCDRGYSALPFEGIPMSMKHRRGNREARSPSRTSRR
jgi:hypothetical protein